MLPERQRFVDHVKRACMRHGVRMRLSDSENVGQGDGCPSAGYFDDAGKELAVAMRCAAWFDTLAHEYCHMLQWAAGSPLWTRSHFNDYFEWCGGLAEIPRATATLASRRHLACELDCERRTSVMLRRWGLADEDYLSTRARECNAYILMYSWMERFRVWPNVRPYKEPDILAIMPTRFMPAAWYASPDPDYVRIVFERCLTRRQRRLAWEYHLAV